MRMTGLSTTDGWRLSWPRIGDVYLEMTAVTGTGSGTDHYGLIFRVPDIDAADRGYLFGVTCDGRYSLRAWDGEEMTSLVRATSHPSIRAGSEQTNRVGVMAQGDRLRLYVNGVLLQEIRDETFTAEGGFGVFIGARTTSGFSIEVTEVAYWDIP